MRLVIFDIDGTLTTTNRADAECFLRALAEEVGVTKVSTDLADYTDITDSGITRQIFRERFARLPSADELARLQDRFVRLLEETFTHVPGACAQVAGAAQALQVLQRSPDWAVAIATGGWRASALLKLRWAQIDATGIPAAFADDGTARHEIVQAAVARSKDQSGHDGFHRIVYVGDGVWDIQTAHRLRLAFVGVSHDGRGARLRKQGASHVIGDFTDVDTFLRALEEAAIPSDGVRRP